MKEIAFSFVIAVVIVGAFFTYFITTNDVTLQTNVIQQKNEELSPKPEIRQETETVAPTYTSSTSRDNIVIKQEPVNQTDEIAQPNAEVVVETTNPSLLPPNAVVQTSINELTSERKVGSDIVVGYIWRSSENSPKFQSLRIPIWDFSAVETEYQIDVWNGSSFIFYQKAKPLVDTVTFPEGGVGQFRVTGLDPAYAICPGERSRFTWGITFATSGIFEGERIPITIDGSEKEMSCKVAY